MPQVLTPTNYILTAAEQIKCEIPLTSIEKCQHKCCKQNNYNQIDEFDKHWSNFFKSQQNSNANYIYKIKTYGNAQAPKQVKRTAVSTETINQCLIHMPVIGGLSKADLFYILSFMLNLTKEPLQIQKEYMELMLSRKVLDVEIMKYLQLISQHPKVGLTSNQLEDFQKLLQSLIDKETNAKNISYYNPEHIFLKALSEINPYELEYLKAILHSNKQLTSQQTLYLAKFLYKLQELPDSVREEYLQFLRDNRILPFNSFKYLLIFLVMRAKKVDQNKLRNLLRELQNLLGIGPYKQEPKAVAAKIKEPDIKIIDVDHLRIHKALMDVMTSVVPNIVRLTELRKFLKDMMILREDQVMYVFNGLKITNVMTPERFRFIENFILNGRLGKVDKAKVKQFVALLQKVAAAPINRDIVPNLNIPARKGPVRKQVIKKEVTADEPPKEVVSNAKDLAKKKETTNEQDTKSRKDRKRSMKPAKKNSKRKAK